MLSWYWQRCWRPHGWVTQAPALWRPMRAGGWTLRAAARSPATPLGGQVIKFHHNQEPLEWHIKESPPISGSQGVLNLQSVSKMVSTPSKSGSESINRDAEINTDQRNIPWSLCYAGQLQENEECFVWINRWTGSWLSWPRQTAKC